MVYDIVYIITMPIWILAIYKLVSSSFEEPKYSRKAEIVSYVIYGVLMSVVYLLIRVPMVLLFFNIISLFLVTLNYDSKFMYKVVCTFSVYIFLALIETVIWRLSGSFEMFMLKNTEYNSVVGLIMARVLTLAFSHIFEKVKKSKDKKVQLPYYYYTAQLVILIALLYLFLVSINGTLVTIWQIIFSGGALVLITSITILVDEKVFNTIVVEGENKLLKQQNLAYENQFEIEKLSMEEMKSIRHDIKNHILVLNSIYKRGKAQEFEEYISKIISDIDNENKMVNTNNFIVDSILNVKLKELANENVKLTTDIRIQSKLNILSYDLTTILSNLIDNAITAVRKCEDSRKLSLYMHCVKGSLIILIDNSFNENIIVENGSFKTTKKQTGEHGIGIKNIKDAVEKYNGDIRIDYTENLFSVEILIPNIG